MNKLERNAMALARHAARAAAYLAARQGGIKDLVGIIG